MLLVVCVTKHLRTFGTLDVFIGTTHTKSWNPALFSCEFEL